MATSKIGIIISSVRPNRFADHPARWIQELVSAREDMEGELLDLRDFPLPFFEETASPAGKQPENEVAQRWDKKLAEKDGFIFITAEYNHGITGALKNALDYAYKEWNKKPAACVAYGGVGGARAVEHLRLISVELQLVQIRNAVHIQMPVYNAVAKEGKQFSDFDYMTKGATAMLDQLSWWAQLLKKAREEEQQKKPA